jgi:hypothetical protein
MVLIKALAGRSYADQNREFGLSKISSVLLLFDFLIIIFLAVVFDNLSETCNYFFMIRNVVGVTTKTYCIADNIPTALFISRNQGFQRRVLNSCKTT